MLDGPTKNHLVVQVGTYQIPHPTDQLREQRPDHRLDLADPADSTSAISAEYPPWDAQCPFRASAQ
jgi:hypothetical protein